MIFRRARDFRIFSFLQRRYNVAEGLLKTYVPRAYKSIYAAKTNKPRRARKMRVNNSGAISIYVAYIAAARLKCYLSRARGDTNEITNVS